MRTILALLMVVALCVPAFAGGNPDVQCYVSFDQTGAGDVVHNYDMTMYVGFNAYFCFTELDSGITTVVFRINNPQVECAGLFASQSFTNLMDIIIGDPYTGMSLASTACRPGPVVVGDCCVNILDDPDFPRWVVDCEDPPEADFYCVLENGTIGLGDCPEGDCEINPVEDATWGGIKALYR